MTNPKPRSSFLPIMLLIVGLVVCAAVVVAFVPMVECENCLGLGHITQEELQGQTNKHVLGEWKWEWCEEAGRTTFWRKLFEDPPEADPLDFTKPAHVVRKFLENRKRTP